MAKTGKSILGSISGTIGGTQFRKTRHGQVMGMRGVPLIKRTPLKQLSTGKFGTVSKLWKEVTPPQVEAWNKLAETIVKTDKLGNSWSMRGIDLFKQINRTLMEIGEPVTLSAPKAIFPKPLLAPGFEIIASPLLQDIRLNFSSPIQENTKYIIFATPALRYGINSPNPSAYKIIALIDHTFLSGNSLINGNNAILQYMAGVSNRFAFRIKPVSVVSGLYGADFAVLLQPGCEQLVLKTRFSKSTLKLKTRNSKPEID